MKKKLFFLATFLLILVSFSACEKIKEICETCRYNVYIDGAFSYSELEAEYCGSDLIARKAAPDGVVGNLVSKFECDN